MTDKQLETVVGLLAGMQLAVAHLANVVADKTGISREALADSFEATADAVPAEVAQRALVQTAVRQIASAMRSSAAGPEWDALMQRLQP